MSIFIHTQTKMALPWFIRAIVASAGIFQEFFFNAHRLRKVGCQFYARSCAKRLFEIVIYQVYARN